MQAATYYQFPLPSPGMRSTQVTSRLATNLRRLMKERGWNQPLLAQKSGVSQKTISNMLNPGTSGVNGANVLNVEAVASALGINGWQLLLQNTPTDADVAKTLAAVVDNFLVADQDGQHLIDLTAAREGHLRKAS